MNLTMNTLLSPLNLKSKAATPPEDISNNRRNKIPLWFKLAFTAFIGVWVPVYWANYGPTNFLYFCDMALLLAFAGIWTENRLLVSMPAVGILIPQAVWVLDFCAQLSGHKLTGMTAYMFDSHRSPFLRGLSFFHGWLPFLLIFLVVKLGYDRRAFRAWTIIAWSACLISYFFVPPAGAHLLDPKTPINVDYVFGLDDAAPQKLMAPGAYLAAWMATLLAVVYAPTHAVLGKLFTRKSETSK